MSIQTEITRIEGAKTGLKEYLESVGITVTDDTLIDGMVDLLASIAQPADYPVEIGYANYWRWRKWNSGFAECWYEGYTSAKTVSTQWGSVYAGNAAQVGPHTYPITFTENPDCRVSNATTGLGNQWLTPYSAGTIDKTPSWQLTRGTSGTNQACDYSLYVTGKWK